ncbi:hypothetical protein ACQ4LE_005300 [Meloidogyne hapla]
MEIMFTNTVLINYPSQSAVPNLTKNFLGKRLSLPRHATKTISNIKSCRHLTAKNCLHPISPIIHKEDKFLNEGLPNEDIINGNNLNMVKVNVTNKNEMLPNLENETNVEDYKIDKLPNNYHLLFPFDLIEKRTEKNDKN